MNENPDNSANDVFRQPENPRMPDEARQALVYLMRQGVVLAADKPHIFATICRYQGEIRGHLADVFLYLMLDEKNGVAFITLENQQLDDDTVFANEDEEDARSLITPRTLTVFDTLVLLALRKHYQERETTGEQKIMMDKDRLLANILPMMQAHEREKADKSKLSGCLKRFAERKIIRKMHNDDDRFEITPLIRYILDTNQLNDFIQAYKAQLEQAETT
ncbi:MAG: DUF4194 domain-containing protein [Alysiella sp.]|uniref:DUF4194 domain-containing protein n=1 Tax=Alysiella sp. TaxID=1872483 RepID=UPI0026DC0FD6|nr:DUF4194 domain-containing protein [Alysiella sp.]MDO4433212.1 DUF4194 domain-containing protein [Alysiella sp.]